MSTAKLNPLSIVSLLDMNTATVEIREARGDKPAVTINVRPLSLEEMIDILVMNQQTFLAMYSRAIDTGDTTDIDLGPVLLASPEIVSYIIALATDEENPKEAAKVIQSRMAATVQAAALKAIWELSVPNPKKAQELLSEVTALLRNVKNMPDALEQSKALSGSSAISSSDPLSY